MKRKRAYIRRLIAYAAIDPEERVLAGRVSGWMYILGGITVVSFLVLPWITAVHQAGIIGLGVSALVWGLYLALVLDWDRTAPWLIHASNLLAFGMVAGVVASSGGTDSPGWIYLFFIALFSPYFYRPAIAAVYILGCMITQALPVIYDSGWSHSHYIAELAVALPAYAAFGATVGLGKNLLLRLRRRAELLANEQASLRRIATAVLDGEPPEAIYELVSREAAALLNGGGAGILRFDSDHEATVVGSWAEHESGRYPPGRVVTFAPGTELDRARTGEDSGRVADHTPDSNTGRLGYAASIVVPVKVGERTWGAIAVASREPSLTARDEEQLIEFAGLLASGIASLDDRARLIAQASTDPLTGLANRRALHDRLAAETARAVRHQEPLAVAVVDIDNFKQVNDFHGHGAGDELLVGVARCLTENARTEDTLGRLGGDEFAWVMPETSREQALVAVERARRLIAATCSRSTRISVSAGICDTGATEHPAELLRHADSALYWSKAHGRNRSWIYDFQALEDLAGSERLDPEHSHALLGLQALARAIDDKDAAGNRHSERVADLAAGLARVSGWSPERVMLLKEAALVHDIGKVGVPDALLGKQGPLTAEEREVIRQHAELSARIVESVLAPEQVEWIRAHHEQPDGHGYPQAIGDGEIPEGAALLSVADAWEVMTAGRAYRSPKSSDMALAECARLAGRQFTPAAVGALMKLHAAGELDPDPLPTAAG